MKITKKIIRICPIGSPEYVLLHGTRQIKRGRKPSASLGGIKNPELAFECAQTIFLFGILFD